MLPILLCAREKHLAGAILWIDSQGLSECRGRVIPACFPVVSETLGKVAKELPAMGRQLPGLGCELVNRNRLGFAFDSNPIQFPAFEHLMDAFPGFLADDC